MKVEIDFRSGFCGGVIRAISTAEKHLEQHGGRLYSLGAIVHNEKELSRLESKGLFSLDKEDPDSMLPAEGETIMIRAHGEPPEVYEKLKSKGFSLIDCTCPVVLRLQKDIREAASKGQIIIFGKVGHPEVLGLVGQVNGKAVVVEKPEQVAGLVEAMLIDPAADVELFSQTTMSPQEYIRLQEELAANMQKGVNIEVHDTICSQVAQRYRNLSDFAFSHDVVVFVSGRHSSNGKVLSDLCRSCNFRTFTISSASELKAEWFRPDDTVGVSGATSTPLWLLEEIAQAIENLQ